MPAGFPMGGAVALSNVTIFGGALVNAAFNFGARHPFKDAPLVDWDLALVMEPSTILGALAGTYINHVSCDKGTGISMPGAHS